MFKDVLDNVIKAGLLSDETDKLYVSKYGKEDIMLHCAEEMSECASALNKYLRVIRETGVAVADNVTEEKAFSHLKEELADAISMGLLVCRKLDCIEEVCDIHIQKSTEFVSRM